MTTSPASAFVPAPDLDALQAMVDAARMSCLALGRHALDALGPDTVAVVNELLDAGWSLAVEATTDRLGNVGIALTMVPASGLERRVLATIAQGARAGSAH